MGHYAQRNEVIAALKSAVDSNTDLREEGYNFNLLAAPGYPELIPNLVALNKDRGQTGFVIGDVSMVLPNTATEIINYEGQELVTADPYLAVYYPSALTNDLSGNEIAVPASHMMLRTYLYNDQVAYPWFAPAGTRRGLIDNALAIGYIDSDTGSFMRTGINNALRDTLYDNRINPITLLNGVGIVAYGQKTRNSAISNAGTSLDRINVARLVAYLRTILTGVANQFIFEPNDKITRDQIKTAIDGIMNDLVAKRGLYDYLVVCDETNNTSDRIARNELYVDVAIEPMKSVEFIYIPIRLKNPGTITGSSVTAQTGQ
jgi:phage tail sheath protein FI